MFFINPYYVMLRPFIYSQGGEVLLFSSGRLTFYQKAASKALLGIKQIEILGMTCYIKRANDNRKTTFHKGTVLKGREYVMNF